MLPSSTEARSSELDSEKSESGKSQSEGKTVPESGNQLSLDSSLPGKEPGALANQPILLPAVLLQYSG